MKQLITTLVLTAVSHQGPETTVKHGLRKGSKENTLRLVGIHLIALVVSWWSLGETYVGLRHGFGGSWVF